MDTSWSNATLYKSLDEFLHSPSNILLLPYQSTENLTEQVAPPFPLTWAISSQILSDGLWKTPWLSQSILFLPFPGLPLTTMNNCQN